MEASAHLPLRRQAVWVVACRVVGISATLASHILAARLLGPAEFGSYLLITTIIALGSLLSMVGLNEAGLRFVAESLALGRPALARGYVRQILATASIASATSAVVVAAGLAAFEAFAGHAPSPRLLVAIGIGVAVLAWQQLGAELIRAYGNLRLASFFSGGQAGGPVSNLLFLSGLGTAVVLAVKLDAATAVAISVASLCITCPLVYLALRRTSSDGPLETIPAADRLSRQQRGQLLTVGTMLLLNQLLAFATQQLDLWLAGGLLTAESLGLYGAAKRSLLLAAMPVQMAMLTIVSAIPRLYAQGRTQDLERVVRQATAAAAIAALPALIALTLFPGPILATVLGPSYSGAGATLAVLVLGHYVLVLSGNPQHVLTMTGRHRAVLAVNCFSAVVLIAVGAIGARLFGAPGLAAGSAASLALQNGALWWLAHRELGVWTHLGSWQRAPRMDEGQVDRDPPQPLAAEPQAISLSAAFPR